MSILVGMPWLRQLRIKKGKLRSEYIIFINRQVIAKNYLNSNDVHKGASNFVQKISNLQLKSAFQFFYTVEIGKCHSDLINSSN